MRRPQWYYNTNYRRWSRRDDV